MRLLSACFVLFQVVFAGLASACHLTAPQGALVLTIEGQIQHCTEGLEARFDMELLETLPKRQITTGNPWEEGVATYEGVLLRDLMEHVGAKGTLMRIAALNDYSASMDLADAQSIDVILAYKRNGEYMPVRSKGPLFVVFPFTDQPSLADQEHYAQSVWQVSRITVQ